MGWKSIVRNFIPPVLMRALRPSPVPRGIYKSATETVAAANAAGLSVCDYVERLWGVEGNTARLVQRLRNLGTLSTATKNIVEIGPGTGRYIEHALKHCAPERYQIYEIDQGWSSWLAKTYAVEACPADGRSLSSTDSHSCDLIWAHGVFVYLPFLTSYRYFKEIIRVAAPGAFVVFDIISEQCLAPETVEKWIASGHEYPCFLSSAYVKDLFSGFRFVTSFLSPYGAGWSEYLVFTQYS